MANDRELLKGFLNGESAHCVEALARVRVACTARLIAFHKTLRHVHDEIADAAEMRLFEWRAKHLAGDKRFDLDESLESVASRLVNQEVAVEQGYGRRQRMAVESETERQRPRAEAADGIGLEELEDELDALPEEIRVTLIAEAQRVLGDGPPLANQLGLGPAAARKRLERARKALRERLWGIGNDEVKADD